LHRIVSAGALHSGRHKCLETVKAQSQVPTATYRLQLNHTFTFRDAASIVSYLHSLGISHCYVSPYLRARPGSLHGYDIIDHNALNPEIGTSEDYEHFVDELHRHGMGQILDIVPNHMGVMGSDNAWWLDVLENGEASDYSEFFDIDWNPIKEELQGKVLIPVLGDQYGNELERGQLKLVFDLDNGAFSIFYHEHRFPVDPSEYPRIFGYRIDKLEQKLGATNEDFLELQSISTAFGHLPGRSGLSREQSAERNREKEVQKRRLAVLASKSEEIREFLLANVEAFNGRPGDPRSFDSLHELIKAQAYRLAQWRVAADDINYRRFFDINDLAALRVENDAVFEATHRLIVELVAEGKVDGLRIDHPDGLYDPAKYLRELYNKLATGVEGRQKHAYLIVEKILTGNEHLRPDWPVDGTTGYEFANAVNGLFVDRNSVKKMERIYRAFTRSSLDLADLVYESKKLILKVSLASELNVLANLLGHIALSNRHTCDFTLNSLRSALAEIIASFPVYRTYVNNNEVSDEDRSYVERALSAARRRSNTADLSVFDFIRHVLLVQVNGAEPETYQRAVVRFAMKFQQVTAAVMAKGLEDTAFYRYNRLVSLNEVGGNPGKFGISVEEFHRANQQRRDDWPHSMLATSTHDSKRSEDARARINVLSEIPSLWRRNVGRWRDWNRGKKTTVDDEAAPSRNDEYLLYQTLVGTWPGENSGDEEWATYTYRIEQYMLKAAREAKECTRWANADSQYERALSAFVHSTLDRSEPNPFLEDFAGFHRRVNRIGALNSLSQCLLKLTCPGVPDIYQGNELFEFALVDPDNRRPVDYHRRSQLLQKLCNDNPGGAKIDFETPAADPTKPSLKLYITWKTLQVRNREKPLFEGGSYIPLAVAGHKAEHVVAFAREHQGRTVIIAVPRLCATLLGQDFERVGDETLWGNTRIEIPNACAPCFHNAFSGECTAVEVHEQQRSLPVAKIFLAFPVALMLSES
jgi:(1->4)-alpha-D-glucan 1-alpha-D-glucosylmutase